MSRGGRASSPTATVPGPRVPVCFPSDWLGESSALGLLNRSPGSCQQNLRNPTPETQRILWGKCIKRKKEKSPGRGDEAEAPWDASEAVEKPRPQRATQAQAQDSQVIWGNKKIKKKKMIKTESITYKF